MRTIVDRPKETIETSALSALPEHLRYKKKKASRVIIVFEWIVILTAATGFTYKFIEFTYSVLQVENEAVNFAITPLVMYVSVALGFFLLFIWSLLRGDFKEIEKPKFRIFEREMMAELEEERDRIADQHMMDQPSLEALPALIKKPISVN
jgi:hypothetical protein